MSLYLGTTPIPKLNVHKTTGSGQGNYQSKTVSPTLSSQTVTADDDYDALSSVTVNAMPTASQATPSINVSTSTGVVTASSTQSAGYVSAGTTTATEQLSVEAEKTVTPTASQQTAVAAGKFTTGPIKVAAVPSETKSITQNGTYTPTSGKWFSSVTVTVSGGGGSPTIDSLTVTPSESEQTFNSSSVDGYKPVTVSAISSTYVGSGITRRDDTDLSASGATVTVPAGYYESQETKSVSTMTLPTSTSASATTGYTSKATVSRSTSDQYINIPTGYNTAGGYYKIEAVANGSVTAPASISGTSASISTGSGTLTLSKTISVTPSVTTAGYISSGTAGNAAVSLTASVTVNPTPTASGKTVTTPAGYYSASKTTDVSTMTLPTAASSTSSGTSKATIGRSTSNQYINIPTGYNESAAYYTISAVANGSATNSGSVSGSSATVSTGTNTITLTKSVSITPTVSAGYVSSGTAGNVSVALTASVTTKAAATYHPSTTAQSISSGTYLTGTQTIAAVTTTNLSASNILNGVTIKVGDSSDDDCVASVTGNVVFQTIYTGTGAPSSGTGVNGDIYVRTA